jgi:negative regulator of sigma E activity
MQGIESVDDGDRWQTVLPDEHKVVDDDSPLKFPSDDKARLALCRRNYKFSFDGEAVVAGRRAYRILAKPRHSDLNPHRFYLDRKTYYPLKAETILDGDEKVEFETLSVSYPESIEEEHFTLHAPPSMRWEKYNRPAACPSAKEAEKELGFKPVLPKHLPMGFELLEMQFNDSPHWKSLQLRLTDGLARATIYEYRQGSDSMRAMENSSSGDVRGVQLLVVSDIDEEFRQQLLDSFENDAVDRSSDAPLLAGLQWARSQW